MVPAFQSSGHGDNLPKYPAWHINGTHIHVSPKHLSKYLGEFEYRWNMRDVPHLMLERLMHSFAR